MEKNNNLNKDLNEINSKEKQLNNTIFYINKYSNWLFDLLNSFTEENIQEYLKEFNSINQQLLEIKKNEINSKLKTELMAIIIILLADIDLLLEKLKKKKYSHLNKKYEKEFKNIKKQLDNYIFFL